MQAVSAASQIYAAEGAANDETEGSPQAYQQSIGQIDPKSPGWTRRVRIGAALPGRTLCPNRTTALEKAIRGFTELHPGVRAVDQQDESSSPGVD